MTSADVAPVSVPRFGAATARWVLAVTAHLLVWSWIPDRCRGMLRSRLSPIGTWIWAARWRRVTIRAVAVWHAAGALMLVAAAPAHADATKGVPENPIFSWMKIEDSHGISVWRYFMSIDEGSTRHPLRTIYSFFIKLEYEIYRALAGGAIYLITYAVSFDWLATLIEPVRTIGEAMTSMTQQFSLTTTLLTATALVAGIWMLRGRWTTGIYELVVSCAIAALAVGVLSNPVERVAGQDGLIMQARDAGLQLSAGIANKGDMNADPDVLLDQLKATLADTLVRQPTQMLNFGRVVDTMPDAQSCIEAWDRGHDDAPGNTRDTLKDNIRNCEGGGDNFWDSNGGAMKDFADNPGIMQVIAAAVLIVGGGVLFIFGIVLALAMVLAACTALVQALKAIVVLVLGVLPGAARGALWRTAANLAMALVIMVFAIVFVVGFMIVIQAFFNSEGSNLFKKFVLVDGVLVLGVVMFRRGTKALRRVSETLAQKMATRPGASPTAISRPAATTGALQSAYYATNVAKQAAAASRGAFHAGAGVARAAKTMTKSTGAVGATAATAGLATAVMVGKGAAVAAKKSKQKIDGIGDNAPRRDASTSTAQGAAPKSDRRSGSSSAMSNAATEPIAVAPLARSGQHSGGGAAANGLPRRQGNEIAKPGIKRTVGTAVATHSALSDRGGATRKVVSTSAGSFREYLTGNGSPVLLPERGTAASRRRRIVSAPSEISTGPTGVQSVPSRSDVEPASR